MSTLVYYDEPTARQRRFRPMVRLHCTPALARRFYRGVRLGGLSPIEARLVTFGIWAPELIYREGKP